MADSPAAFVHLHVHSEYSLSDGTIRIPQLVKRAAALGASHLALTDHGTMHAAVEFYLAAKKSGLIPLIGCELYCQGGEASLNYARDFERPHPAVGFFQLVALARTTRGYHELMKLVSSGFLAPDFRELPTIGEAQLDQAEEQIFISSCTHSEFSYLVHELRLTQGETTQALDFVPSSPRAEQLLLALHQLVTRMLKRAGPGNFYIELCANNLPGQELLVEDLVSAARFFQLPVVASANAHYLHEEDEEIHALALAIKNGLTQSDISRRLVGTKFHLTSNAEMQEKFARWPEALSNTREIAEKCSTVSIKMDTYFLPKIKIAQWDSSAQALQNLSRLGLQERFAAMNPQASSDKIREYEQRLEYELTVIIQMGFPDYFLIVQDFINWAKQQDIPVGPGRGSGAGSLVAYALRITDIDPLPYNLIFERFLNPERISMPDFDVDFCQWRRDEVIHYCISKYGWQSVAQITTFGKMQAKGAVKSVGRAMNISYTRMDQFTKLFPTDLGITLNTVMEQEPRIVEAMELDDDLKACMENALKLEGLISHSSVHAAGLVISDGNMSEYIPTYTQDGKALITQYEMKPTEKVGLVKFDFLGLKTLTVIAKAVELINRQAGEQPFAIEHIPRDDPRVYQVMSQGHTCGIFQCESLGITKLIKKLQPNCFEEVIALVALYRPGPLGSGMVDSFVERKHGRQAIVYSHPLCEPILRETYGMILYQEQVQKIAAVLANYSLGEADLLRRAMGKKIPEEMAKQRDRFVKGALSNHLDPALAEEIFDLMAEFANYGFNKSHSAAYGLLSYQTAYLKTHYPEEFFAASMTCDMDNSDKVARYFEDCQRLGIRVLAPDINHGGLEFSVPRRGEICFALSAIKGIGQGVVKQIIAHRANGPFRDLRDFATRFNLDSLGKKTLQLLTGAGAFDCFTYPRKLLDELIPALLAYSSGHHQAEERGERGLFELLNSSDSESSSRGELPPWEEARRKMRASATLASLEDLLVEKKLLGMYVSRHPLASMPVDSKYFGAHAMLRSIEERLSAPPPRQEHGRFRERLCFIAMLTALTYRRSKKGKLMASLLFEQAGGGRLEVLVFEEVLQRLALPPIDTAVLVAGNLEASFDQEIMRFNVELVRSLEDERRERLRGLLLTIDVDRCSVPADSLVAQLGQLFAEDQGTIPSRVKLSFPETVVLVDTSTHRLRVSNNFLHQLSGLLDGCGTIEYALH